MKGGTARALPMLDVPESQVDPRLSDARFFGDLVLEVLLRVLPP